MSLKTLNSPSYSHSPSSSSLSSMKLKALLQTFIFSHMYRIASKAKSIITQLLKTIQFPLSKNKNKHKKLFFGSFRLHYNWCSNSHRINNHAMLPYSVETQHSANLSKYLQCLEEEEKKADQEYSINEIDKLADLFIANSHEKFILEKQESYRMFQEMMARSI